MKRILLAATALVASFLHAPAQAQPVDDFYRGRNLMLVVGYGPGGGYDVYARVMARFIGRHVPGNPNVVVQNMPGAGSLLATNFLYNTAPKEGSTIGSAPSPAVPTTPI